MDNEKKATYMRIGIILFFGLGSVVGGFVFHKVQYMGFLIPVITSGILFIGMFYYQFITVKN